MGIVGIPPQAILRFPHISPHDPLFALSRYVQMVGACCPEPWLLKGVTNGDGISCSGRVFSSGMIGGKG